MQFAQSTSTKRPKVKNPLEKTLEDTPATTSSFLNELLRGRRETPQKREEKKAPLRTEFTIFSKTSYQEQYIIPKQIKDLTEEVRREITLIKKQNKALVNQIKDIEKHTIETLPQKAGIYHIRLLETFLSFLKVLQAKVGEAKTWLSAMQSKKKKRGSLFAARSKQKGTQYSLSQELTTARSVQ